MVRHTTPPAVIFDVDGTLVDSNDAHARAWVDALSEHGYTVPLDRVRPLIGMGGDKLLPAVTGLEEESPRGQTIATRRGEIFEERYRSQVRAFDGAGDLLRALASAGHPLAVASSAKQEELRRLLNLTGAGDVFQHLTSSDDVAESKPDPDAVHQALAKMKAQPADALMIGDTPYDLEAASRAGVAFIAFRSGGWPDPSFADAVAVFDGPRDLLDALGESPLDALLVRGRRSS